MGKASRRRREARQNPANRDIARASQQERFAMIAASLPRGGGGLSVAQALAVGSVLVAANNPRNDTPEWFRDGWDVVDLLTAGMHPSLLPCSESRFSAVRDTWLDQLRTEPFWGAVTDMLETLLQISHDTATPVDDPEVVMALVASLVDVPSCMQPIAEGLRPAGLAAVRPSADGVGRAVVREALALRPGIRVLTDEGEAISLGDRNASTLRELADGRAEMLGRPLEPGERIFGEEEVPRFEAFVEEMMAAFELSPAIRHASKVTGFMPPGREGLPNQHHQDEWEQVLEVFLQEHPDIAAAYDPEAEAEKIGLMRLKIVLQADADSLANRAGTIRDLRKTPEGDLAQIIIRMVPMVLGAFGRRTLLDAAGDWARGVDGAPSMTDLARALLWLERSMKSGSDGYTTEEAVQAASLAAEFYCAIGASEELR
ncbi:hypothetical protein [Streptomyces sp. RKAG337]|uniref:hypothetical protein n=1 Tax=Streptomyces sp. RKAG337 TaxID=2893404 RepID=UPI0020331DF6|nr:hypothetical protein [Streptomyces sp. RKAG337]MCM2431083.1 hypothetical protein [Streptomyces sp. RKAG337]